MSGVKYVVMTDERNRVAEELAELRGTITTFMQTWRTQDDRAAASRQELYRGQNDVKIALGGVTRDLAEVVNDVAEIRPKVEKLEQAYDRGWGVVWTIRAVVGLLLLALGWMIAHLTSLSMQIR